MRNHSKELIVYPNCSMGGMATVFRNRIKYNPEVAYHLIFVNDLGGRSYFDDLPNARITIVRKDRLKNYLQYLFGTEEYERILVTSMPDVMMMAAEQSSAECIYEFHTSTDSIIEGEIARLEFGRIDSIQVPSLYLRDVVQDYLKSEFHQLLRVEPNLVDTQLFTPKENLDLKLDFSGLKPLIWLGRLDAGKNVNDFLRVLSRLDDSYCGVVVLGLESDPARFSSFLGYASSLGVRNRIKVLVNLPQTGIADLYNSARKMNGFFISTSLGESFGYGVQEALSTGLSTVAYRVGALAERTTSLKDTQFNLVDVGDIESMVAVVENKLRTNAGSSSNLSKS